MNISIRICEILKLKSSVILKLNKVLPENWTDEKRLRAIRVYY